MSEAPAIERTNAGADAACAWPGCGSARGSCAAVGERIDHLDVCAACGRDDFPLAEQVSGAYSLCVRCQSVAEFELAPASRCSCGRLQDHAAACVAEESRQEAGP